VTIGIAIADDQALVRGGFRVLVDIAADMEVLGEANDGAEAVALARGLRPDVVLMDVRLPVQDGIEATRQIKEDDETADVKVLILTTFDLGQYVYAAREVLREVARGLSNTEIAERLHRSAATAKTHVSRLLMKLLRAGSQDKFVRSTKAPTRKHPAAAYRVPCCERINGSRRLRPKLPSLVGLFLNCCRKLAIDRKSVLSHYRGGPGAVRKTPIGMENEERTQAMGTGRVSALASRDCARLGDSAGSERGLSAPQGLRAAVPQWPHRRHRACDGRQMPDQICPSGHQQHQGA
jgi:CheY-like chemotaxis protein